MVVFVCLSQFLLPGAGVGEVVDRIVAQVNDEIITMSELEQTAKATQAQSGQNPLGRESKAFQRQMLDSLIDRKLALAEAKKRGISLSDRELDQALEEFKKRNDLADDAALTKALSQAGMTLKELKQQISDQMIQDRMVQVAVGAKTMVSDADVRRVYEESTKEGGNQVHLKMIQVLFPPEATTAQKEELRRKVEAILKEVQEGRSFSEAARKHSVSEADLGFIPLSDMAPPLIEYLKRLRPGEVAPVQSPEGFQLMQLVARRSGPPRSFEEVAPEIRRALMRQEMGKRFSEWVKTLKDKAFIKIML
jgi:peptidyl-prolyl cis-trans isomerase SurA